MKKTPKAVKVWAVLDGMKVMCGCDKYNRYEIFKTKKDVKASSPSGIIHDSWIVRAEIRILTPLKKKEKV